MDRPGDFSHTRPRLPADRHRLPGPRRLPALAAALAVAAAVAPSGPACATARPGAQGARKAEGHARRGAPHHGTEYHVGPGQALANLGDVPWYRLQPGDTVYVHWRPAPYREKILISGRGTPTHWIRVLGVPGPNGELPVISGDGATTSRNMHYRWQDATGGSAIQQSGVVQIAVRADDPSGAAPLPGYVEIANLRVQDAYTGYRFRAENGVEAGYGGFAACIYARSAQHLLVRDNVLANCGLGFYDWTGDGSSDAFWVGLEADTVLRGNEFVGNGAAGDWSMHQVYTESDGVLIEHNRFGPMRRGALGSQIKDRSAGTVIRYNFIEQSPAGWDLDLVEPEEGWLTLGARPSYRQAFVYGNVIVSRAGGGMNLVHWNEDHQAGRGRATLDGGRLFFYANTVAIFADRSEVPMVTLFNGTWGAYDCPPGPLPGVIDVRNNVIALLPRTPGARAPVLRWRYCGSEGLALGRNWVSPGWITAGRERGRGGPVTGEDRLVSPDGNDPGFVAPERDDFGLGPASSARGIGGSLAPEVTHNALGLDLTPTAQYAPPRGVRPRASSGEGSDAGALAP